MVQVSEIAPDVFRLCTYIPDLDLQFSQFLVRDDEPLLYHTGMRSLFPDVRDAVATLIEPSELRWIGLSHFEPDECGSLNEWLALAPRAQPLTSEVGALVFIGDYAAREPRAVADDAIVCTGQRRFRLRHTPHLPHGWDASMLFEETTGVLFCSDLFHQLGDVEAMTGASVIDRCQYVLRTYQQGPLANYVPFTTNTQRMISELAALGPSTCATMHGSAYSGDGGQALEALGTVIRELYETDETA
jgi:flavorubredoxin